MRYRHFLIYIAIAVLLSGCGSNKSQDMVSMSEVNDTTRTEENLSHSSDVYNTEELIDTDTIDNVGFGTAVQNYISSDNVDDLEQEDSQTINSVAAVSNDSTTESPNYQSADAQDTVAEYTTEQAAQQQSLPECTTDQVTVQQDDSGCVTEPTTEAPVIEYSEPDSGYQIGGYASAVVAECNAERAAYGKSQFTESEALNLAAQKRAQEASTLFSHTRPNGTTCFTVLDEYGIIYVTTGENIAMGYNSASSVVDGWMSSDGHRANILNDSFKQMGVGVYMGADGYMYWAQLFTN